MSDERREAWLDTKCSSKTADDIFYNVLIELGEKIHKHRLSPNITPMFIMNGVTYAGKRKKKNNT